MSMNWNMEERSNKLKRILYEKLEEIFGIKQIESNNLHGTRSRKLAWKNYKLTNRKQDKEEYHNRGNV